MKEVSKEEEEVWNWTEKFKDKGGQAGAELMSLYGQKKAVRRYG